MHLAVFLWISCFRWLRLTFKMPFQWMMLVVWLQVGSGDRSNYRGVEENGLFGRGRSETSRIMRRTNEGKDKMNGDKGAALEGPAVTQPIMSMHRKDRGIWSVEELKGQTFRGKLKWSTVVVKYLKVRLRKGTFSLEKLVNHLLVRGTISFYNQRLQLLPAGESEMWNLSMGLNEQCWRGTILFWAMFH